MNQIRLKSIGELLNEKFNIPSYQRGYRWTVRQIEDLLNDILEFQQSKNDGFYCLQPIVVKKNRKNIDSWHVIDGQQRLTSIKIILMFLNSRFTEEFRKSIYSLSYESRKKSEEYLNHIIDDSKDDNIDYFHMHQAYITVKKWFGDKQNIVNEIESILLNSTKVIWYEVADNQEDEINIFTRINMGKIPLTNAELIKALLLKKHKHFDEKSQFELASQWDNIEYTLQKNDFWFFLNSKDNKATRIEFIFELLSSSYKEAYKLETYDNTLDIYYTFHVINSVLANNQKTNLEIWNDVKTFFRILLEWFENRELFHKIGFLIMESETTVDQLIIEARDKNKDEFRNSLNEKIKIIFKGIDIENLEYGDKNIKKVLLFFNIQTLLNNEKSNSRFEFDRFKKDSWDIEHIRSQSDAMPSKPDEKADFVQEYCQDENKKELYLKSDDEFKKFYNYTRTEIEGSDFEKASISNLALLDSKTNRSYKNAFFPVKRNTILKNDMNGTFIPICTKNVFMKYYTVKPENLYQWTDQDAQDYLTAIKETLKDFLLMEQDNGN
ncbi:DUF262 domain-containing protein [Sulfuricurvum sp.]|uniref:DUF262 domain-containing protein n=1 Tax=Sulfuricurvum sp. TaxID=2025608 RepID=UPI00262CFF3F|nr:DUF262 domain-containing protein [Sulfuricurvum sp.]MDD3596497.1 DUF262 domain-containing protein [Sulfuricurvum sp.]